ncbi:MAG: radical SAM protein [Thermoplasmata archaeon]
MRSKLAYGPVPSRRLGQSLGVNNILPKICTYSCVYCQLGRTLKMHVEREEFYTIEEVSKAVKEKVEKSEENDETVDYISFVPDGEPSLDKSLGDKIEFIKELGFKVAVISNGSLIYHEQVREDLSNADWVSLKMDAVSPEVWKKVNRPHKDLELDKMMEGLRDFSDTFDGKLNTETMLVEGVNDETSELKKIADRVTETGADRSYIAIPTRPPAEEWVKPPDEKKITEAYKIFENKGIDVEHLIGYEGDTFASSGDLKEDLLSITSVHPMRERQVQKLLSKNEEDWSTVQELIDEGELIETEFEDEKFYIRNIKD